MEGGFLLDEFAGIVDKIAKLKGVVIEGVSTFPVLAYNKDGVLPVPTPNLMALKEAKKILEIKGIVCNQVNGSSNNCCSNMKFLAEHGVTHVEPGSALTGSNTYHLFADDQPEKPAMVYLTEVSHLWNNKVYVYGGGFFMDNPPVSLSNNFKHKAFFGNVPEKIMEQKLGWIGTGTTGGSGFARIDYHGILESKGQEVHVGDTVIFGFRGQLFMDRSYSAVVEGLSYGKPRLVGIWDWAGHRVGGGLE